MEPIFFHIDVNSAFLSWTALSLLEQGESVDLRTIPAIIGGDMEKRHGVVLAKSVPAKAFRIQTGEPIVNALRKCPSLRMASPDHAMYRARSEKLMEFLSSFCPEIEQVSIDECYMDFTPIAHLYSSPLAAAEEIKDSVFRKFGFTVNVGISNRKVLAKMASDFQKPNLVHTLFTSEIKEKLWQLPVSRLFMCGHSSVEVLRNLEILTIGDLAQADPAILTSHLKSHGQTLWEYANGIDDSRINSTPAKAKGIGNSTTLKQDAETKDDAFPALLKLSESVSRSLRKSGQLAGMVSCEIKYNTFRSVSHQTTLTVPTDATDLIYHTACQLFDELWDGTPIRLLGVRTAKLTSGLQPVQMNLFDYAAAAAASASIASDKQQRLDQALDRIKNKYGEDAIVRGSLLHKQQDYQKH